MGLCSEEIEEEGGNKCAAISVVSKFVYFTLCVLRGLEEGF